MISTKGRYALRMMIDLAEHSDRGYVPLKDISERQQISKKYMEIIVKDLVLHKFISGVSGKGGGYRLLRDPSEYTVGEILEAMEGSLSPVACLSCGSEPCPRSGKCKTLPMWSEFDALTRDFFFGRKLSDLVRKEN